MSSLTDQKIEKFTTILKSLGYSKNVNYNAIKAVIETPELKSFFDWFNTHANDEENIWLITNEQLELFQHKVSKGQVIWDLNKLVETNNLINNSFDAVQSEHQQDDYENITTDTDLESENKLIEKEIQLLSEQLTNKRSRKDFLSQKLISLKSEQTNIDLMTVKLNKKMTSCNLVTISQSIETCLNKFQDLIGTDEKYQTQINNDLNKIESNLNEYLTNEKCLFDQLLNKMFLKFEYDHIEKSIKLTESNEIKNILNLTKSTESKVAGDILNNINYDKIEKILKQCVKYYPKLVQDWFMAKVKLEIDKCENREMHKILENKSEFFEYSQSQLEQDTQLRSNLEQKTKQILEKHHTLIKQIESTNKRAVSLLDKYSNLKSTKIIENDMKKKQIELNLFLNKQDKLCAFLENQLARLELVNGHLVEKLNEMNSFKHLLLELIKQKSNFRSTTNNKTNNNNINLSNMSFTNLLSSTSISTPTKMTNPRLNNVSMISESTSMTFIHLINQLLISILTSFKTDKLSQKYIKLNKPVSVCFSENLNAFFDVYESICLNIEKTQSNNHSITVDLMQLIDASIRYLYFSMGDDLNKKKNKLTTVECLEKPFRSLEIKLNSLEENVALNVFSKIKKNKEKFKSNKLEELRRNFFVLFFNNPHLVESVIENLNLIL
jgi:hypothetical protein